MTPTNVPAIPEIIQGGMGIYVSNPFLTNAVSRRGALGTVSGVMPDRIMARILGKGDPGGHYRRALSHFPYQKFAEQVLNAFYIEEGNPKCLSEKVVPFFNLNPADLLIALSITANFAFIFLAKEGHDNPVSVNYMEKISPPHIYALTGAMLAGVDFITMGAGIPLQIPEVISCIAEGREVSYRVPVVGSNITSFTMRFNPEKFFGGKLPELKKPKFIPIIASNALASIFMKKLPIGEVYGFTIEEWTAGGHNAPPRKGDEYGPKDEVDYSKIAEIGLPFWIGGSKASPEKLRWAKSVGAAGIQAGSIFALCEESGMDPKIRRDIRKMGFEGTLEIITSRIASPTGFPFKVVSVENSLSEEATFLMRDRVCSQGLLRIQYEKEDGTIGYRCPAEPVGAYLKKLGKIEDTVGARCICNGLMSTVGLGDDFEPPIITLGDDVSFLKFLMTSPESSYGVADALAYLSG